MLKSPVLCTNEHPDVDSDRLLAASSSISVVAEGNRGDEESYMTLESRRGVLNKYINHFTANSMKDAPTSVSKTIQSKTGKEKSTSNFATTKKKRKSWKKPPDKPKRPPSAYNLFFQLERERILKTVQDKVNTESNSNDISSVDDAACEHEFTADEVAEVAGIQTEMDKPKRKHRKTHGLIGFAELARAIATKWRVMDPTKKIVFNQCAIVEKQKYIARIEEWMDSRKKKQKLQEQEEDVCSVTTNKSNEIRRKKKKIYKKKAFVSPVSIMEEILHDNHLPYSEQDEYNDRRRWNKYQGINLTTYCDHASISDEDYHSPGFGETYELEQNEMASGHKAFRNAEQPEYTSSYAIQDDKKRVPSLGDNAYHDQIRLDSRNLIKGQQNFTSRYHYNDAHERNLYGISLMGSRQEDGGYYPFRDHEKLYDIHDTMYKCRSPCKYHDNDITDTEKPGKLNNVNVDRRACRVKKRTYIHQTDNLHRMVANHDRYYAAECRSIKTSTSSFLPSCQPQNTEDLCYHRPVSIEPYLTSNDDAAETTSNYEQFLENAVMKRNQGIVSYSNQENDPFSSSVDARRLRREDMLLPVHEHKQYSNKTNNKNFDSNGWKYKNEYDNSFNYGWNDRNNDVIGQTVDDYHSSTTGNTTDSTRNLCDGSNIMSDTRSF